MTEPLLIPQSIIDAVVAHAKAESPRECCGFLAGRGTTITHHFPLVNIAADALTRFESSAESTFAAMREMHRLGIEPLAVYHSHPTSPAVPSATDLEWNYSADVANMIVSLLTDPPSIQAWQYSDSAFVPCSWRGTA